MPDDPEPTTGPQDTPPMIVSEARPAAYRRNALRSTGPRTAEGKERSRANALKHGLCASVVVVEDIQVVQQRASEWYDALRPQNRAQAWLVDEVATLSLRIDRSERMERRARNRRAHRADGEAPDLPAILGSRRREKLRKAEARRDSRRRKLDRLRA